VPRADTLHGDWLVSSRAKFKVNWDTEGAAPGGNSHCAKEGFIVSSFRLLILCHRVLCCLSGGSQ